MTDRRVKVTVDADYDPLIKGSGEAVVAVKATQEEMKSLDKTIEETTHDMEKLSVVIIAGKKEVASLGDKSIKAKHDLEQLDARIEASRKATQQLGLEFARTGEKVDATAFSRERSALARLERLRKELTAAGDSNGNGRGVLADAAGVASMVTDAVATGEKVGNGFISGLGSAFDGMGPAVKGGLIAGLVGAVAVAAVPLGAAVAGAVTGVLGVGGIAGGIFAASKDPVVRSAAKDFGTYLSQQFFSGGSVFIDPIRQGLAILKTDVDKLDLGHLFAPAAADVTLLAAGIGNFVNRAAPGFEKALEKSGPFISALADGLGEVGDAFGQFMDDVSRNHGEIEGLRFLFGAVDVTVRILGKSLEFLGATFHVADVAFLKMVDTAASVAKALHLPHEELDRLHNMLEANINSGTQVIPVVKGLGDAFAGSGFQADAYAQSVKEADAAQTDYINHALAAKDATLGVAQGWIDLKDKLQAGKKNWSDNTQAGIDNQQMLVRQVEALQRQRQAAIDAGDGSAAATLKADRAYNDQLAILEQLAVKAGDTKAAFEAMAKTYNIKVDIDVHTAGVKAAAVDKNLAMHGFAGGGTTPAYAPYVVGEHGPEVLWDTKQHYVENKAMAQQSAQAWNGGSSGGGQVIVQNTIWLVDPMTGATLRGTSIREASSRGVPQATIAAAYP